jgi:hypothetical protein
MTIMRFELIPTLMVSALCSCFFAASTIQPGPIGALSHGDKGIGYEKADELTTEELLNQMRKRRLIAPDQNKYFPRDKNTGFGWDPDGEKGSWKGYYEPPYTVSVCDRYPKLCGL